MVCSFFLKRTRVFVHPHQNHHIAYQPHRHRYNSNLVEHNYPSNDDTLMRPIVLMPDPANIYSLVFEAEDEDFKLSYLFMKPPNIHDGEGNIIAPDQYTEKIRDGSIVLINVSFKLYVLPLPLNLREILVFTFYFTFVGTWIRKVVVRIT